MNDEILGRKEEESLKRIVDEQWNDGDSLQWYQLDETYIVWLFF